jgi:hypothetical protein
VVVVAVGALDKHSVRAGNAMSHRTRFHSPLSSAAAELATGRPVMAALTACRRPADSPALLFDAEVMSASPALVNAASDGEVRKARLAGGLWCRRLAVGLQELTCTAARLVGPAVAALGTSAGPADALTGTPHLGMVPRSSIVREAPVWVATTRLGLLTRCMCAHAQDDTRHCLHPPHFVHWSGHMR